MVLLRNCVVPDGCADLSKTTLERPNKIGRLSDIDRSVIHEMNPCPYLDGIPQTILQKVSGLHPPE